MKTSLISEITSVFATVCLLVSAVPHVQAGPGPRVYAPVKSGKAAEVLEPGTHIAVQCGGCGGITLLTVNKDHSNLKSFTCPLCKAEFHTMIVGDNGKSHISGRYVLVDKEGHEATFAALQ